MPHTAIPSELITHHDHIPVYGHAHTICAVHSGRWHDISTWDQGRLPNATDAVCVPAGIAVSLTSIGVTLEDRVVDLERRVAALEHGQVIGPVGSTAECLDLVIGGVLDASGGFILQVRTITVLPNGVLTLRDRGRVTFRDDVIDTVFDPHRFGHGLLCVDGTVIIEGIEKTTWAPLAQEVQPGHIQLLLAQAPSGWTVGDVLVLPDTRQPVTSSDLADPESQTEHVIVQAITGATVTLTTPVQHAHLGWRTQQGQPVIFPDVGNLTRSIVLESANPAGTRAHVLLTGRSDVTTRYAEIREMGRTTFAPLDSTTRDAAGNVTHIGTNQIGRYPWHFHHCLGPVTTPKPYQFEATGLSIQGSPKWGLAIHGSHYGYVGHNVIDGAKGAGIVTETPHEYASIVEYNLIIGKAGSGQRITSRSDRNDPAGDFWHGGVGLGLTSASCTIRHNRIYRCREGIGMAGFLTTIPFWPAFRGADPSTDRQPNRNVEPYYYPFDFPTDQNQVWGCWRGIETWSADAYPDQVDMFPNLTLIHCHQGTDFFDHRETTTKGWRFLGDFTRLQTEERPIPGQESKASVALQFKDSYEFGHTHINCEYRGYDVAYRMITPQHYTRFQNCVFECPVIVYQPLGALILDHAVPFAGMWENCTFLLVNGIIEFIAGDYPKYDITLHLHETKKNRSGLYYLTQVSYQLHPWRDGRNLRVYHWFQAADFALTPIDAPDFYADFPPGVDTNAELIALGTPIFGAVMPTNAEPFGNAFFFTSPEP